MILSGFFKNSSIFLKFSLIGGLNDRIFLFYMHLGLQSLLVCSDRIGSGNAFLSFNFVSAVLNGLSSVFVLLKADMECNPMACFIINKNRCW